MAEPCRSGDAVRLDVNSEAVSSNGILSESQEPLLSVREDSSTEVAVASGDAQTNESADERHERLRRETQAACADGATLRNEWHQQLNLFGSTAFPKLCTVVRQVTAYIIVGQLGMSSLAGLAVGSAFSFLFGFGILGLVVHATAVLFMTAMLQQRFHLLPHHLLHAVVLSLLLCLPATFLLLFSDHILVLSGQNEEVAVIARSYCLALLPRLLLVAVLDPILAFMRMVTISVALQRVGEPRGGSLPGAVSKVDKAAEITRSMPSGNIMSEVAVLRTSQVWPYGWPLAAIYGVTTILDVPLCWLLVHRLGLGVPGAAWAALGTEGITGLALAAWQLQDRCDWLGRWTTWGGTRLSWKSLLSLLAAVKLHFNFLELLLLNALLLVSGLLADPVLATASAAVALIPASLAQASAAALNRALCLRLRLEVAQKRAVEVVLVTEVGYHLAVTPLAVVISATFCILRWSQLIVAGTYVATWTVPFFVLLSLSAATSHANSFIRAKHRALGGGDVEHVALLMAIYRAALPVLGMLVLWTPAGEYKILSLCAGVLVAQAAWLFIMVRIRKRQQEANLARASLGSSSLPTTTDEALATTRSQVRELPDGAEN